MIELSSFAAALGVYLVGAVAPGPGNLAIANTSLNHGRVAGLALAAGVICGSLCWGAMTAAGVSTLLMSHAQVLLWLKLVGACYLFFLAWKSVRQALAGNALGGARRVERLNSPLGFYGQGLGIHLSNPKAALTWFSVATVGLSANAPAWSSFALVAVCALLGMLVFSSYALAFSAQSAGAFFSRTRRPFGLLCGLFYAVIGLGFLRSLF